MVCDLLLCNVCIFLIYELLYEFCAVESVMCQFVPQVSIFVLYIDSYASVYGTIGVLRGSGNPMPFGCVA